MNRAYSVLDVKAVDREKRIIEGIGTTPTPDRMGDVIVTEGVEFKLPIPFLYQHNSRQPLGHVISASVSKTGMRIKAQLAEAGVADFIDEAWNLIRNGLVRGLSIGFRSLEESFDKELNGYRFLRTEMLEMSAVTIPANSEASILTVKSADSEALAASGQRKRNRSVEVGKSKYPGVTGTRKKTGMSKTIGEQISGYEARRAAHAARMTQLMERASEDDRVLDEEEQEEYDGLEAELEGFDDHLARLRKHEKQIVKKAAPVADPGPSEPSRRVIVRSPELPKGIAFARYAMSLAAARGNHMQALEMAKSRKEWQQQTPEVERALKEAVTVGTTTTSGWASQLVEQQYLASEFIEFLRPMTILGQIQDRLRQVPFQIKFATQTAGGAANWVGQEGVKPVSKLTFGSGSLGFAKVAGIIVISEELAKFSSPSAELLVRNDLAETIATFLDAQFITPTVTAVANVSPASVTEGATNQAASGVAAADLRNDIKDLLAVMISANIPTSGGAFVMQPNLALSIGLIQNTLGQAEFPSVNADGGTLLGYQVVTSNSVPSGVLVFMIPSEILFADEGGVMIDVSREATVLMDDGNSPASTTTVNLWQQNLIGLRAERFINWARRRTESVAYLTGANYGGTASP